MKSIFVVHLWGKLMIANTPEYRVHGTVSYVRDPRMICGGIS